MAKNILVNGKNNITAQRRANAMADIQASMANSNSATNVNTTPNLPTTVTRPERTINLQKAQQPTQTKLNNLNQATGTITGNNPAFYNGQLISQNNQPSRFIGFQQNNNFGNTVLTKPATEQQGKSWGNVINGKYVYIPTAEGAAKSYNFKEENRFKDQETALLDLQGDLYKRGKILSESEIKRLYPEFADQMDAIMEFQNEILPIVKEGKGVSGEQISQLYNELIQPKNLKDVDEIKKKTNTETKNRQTLENSIDKALKTNWESLSADGLKYLKNADYLLKVKNAVKEKGVVGGASDSEIIKYLLNNNTELKDLLKEMNSLNLTDKDRAILGQKSSNILSLISANLGSDLITATGQENEFRPTDEEIDTAIKGKEALEKDFWGETWKNIKTKASIPLDSWEKFVYRIGTDLKNANLDAKDYIAKNFPKSVAEQFLGTKLTDDTYNYLVDRIVSFDEERKKINQQSVDDYNRLVNEDYQRKVNENLNPDIEKYINNRSMTRSLLDMDLKGFAYKAAGESASNWEMPLIIGAGAVSSGVGFALMATDSFARENQEAYEELREAGADYEQAREGATIVGLASSAVEVGLEKLLGGVETTASKAIKDIITKDFTKKATEMVAEKGLVELLKNGAVTQFRSSFEEGLEEVLQQVIHNTAIQKYDPNQEITQGLWESFEGGFFNPMNLLAGGGEIFDNISENADYYKQNAYETAYNLGQKTRQVTDKVDNTLNKGAYNAGRGARIVTDAVENAKNKITSQGKTDNTQQQEQGKIVNTTSENQNNINGDNYSQKNKNNKTLNKVQLGMLQNDNRMNPTKITEFKEKFGKDYGQALADMGYTESQETNVPKIEEDTKEIYNEKKKAMNSVQGEFQDRSLADMLEIMLQKAKNTKDYEMIDKYEKLTEKHNTKGLTMAEANDMREEFSYKIKTRWNTENNSDKIDLANNVYTAVRKFLEDTAEANGISDLQEMNREIAMRKYLSTWIGDKAERQSANNMVSLTDWIMLAEAASNPYAAAGLAVKKIVQTPTVKNAVLNAVVGRRENRAIDKQNRQAENKKRMENIESANEGKRLQEELSKSETPALPNGIKLTKVTEIDARKPKNKVTKKNNNKKSDSSSSDDTTPPTGGAPTGGTPTNNQGGTAVTDDTKIKKQPKKKTETKTKTTSKKAAVTDYINETPQNERGQMEEIEAEENLRNNETPQDTVDQIVNEEQYLIDTKKYNPRNKNVAERKIKHETPKEKDIWTDSNGEEVTFYHGTPQGGFEEFSMDFRGKSNDRVGNGDYGRGMYFTPYKETAEGYAKSSKAESTNPEIYETKLRMENPLRLDLYKEFQRAMNKLAKEDTARGYSLLSKEHSENIDRLMKEFGLTEELYDKYEDIISSLGDNRFDVDIRGSGFDGIISEDGKEVIVPNTDQIIIQRHYSTNETTQKPKNKVTSKKTKATNPSKAKTTSLFNEKEVDKGKQSEGLNPDALPLSDYREMQRLNDGEYYSLSSALRKESLKDYMAKKIATKLVGDYDEIIADEFDPENLEDEWVEKYNDVIDMYEAYEEGDLEAADKYANSIAKGKTAKELIEQYKPEYESDLKVYNRLIKKYPSVFANGKIDLTGAEGKARREFASQENETAQDIDYQELSERENETAQIPTIFEEDLEQMNLRELDENETVQTTEEEMNKVTSKKTESKPKNLVTSRIEESNNTDSKAEQIFNTSMDQLKGAKKTSLGALGKVKQTEVKLDNGTTITYIDSSVGKGISQNAIIRVNSPEAGYKTYVVTKIPNNPAEIREGGNVLTDEQVDKVYDILQGKTGEVKVEDMKVDTENIDSKNPVDTFLNNNEAVKKNPDLKYTYMNRLNEETGWEDINTGIRYKGTRAEKAEQVVDRTKLSNGVQIPAKFEKNNYGMTMSWGDPMTSMESVFFTNDADFEYAKFLYDNPNIRSPKKAKATGLKEAIKRGNEIHEEVVKDKQEQGDGLPLNPEKYVWQQPTAEEGIEAVYNETKKISDYFEAHKEFENSGRIGYTEEYRNKIKAAQDALWRKLKFKSDRSKLYQDFVKNIRESNGNEKQLRSIAKNLYIQKVKDDFKNNYNYPTEVTDKVPGLRTAKDNYDRYLKGRDTSFSGKDPRIDYSDKDRIGAGIKRQDGNQITAEQRREIVNGVLEYAKYMGIDMKKMSEDAGVTYVHLNGKHPFLTSKAVGLFHGLFKSISIGADMESYREKMGQSKDAKTETHTVPVVMAHEITHAIDSMFERNLFSEQVTDRIKRKMNGYKDLGDYWRRKEEVTARMVEEYVDVMKGGKGYYNMNGYWNKEVFDSEIKPYVEQIFNEKFDGYKLTAKERNDIKLDEAQINKNSVTASALNRVTSK